jgi:hypothetical protein
VGTRPGVSLRQCEREHKRRNGGDIEALLMSTVDEYKSAVTHRRPEEVISI